MTETLSKRDVARQEIEIAIRVLFEQRSCIVAHTLAWTAIDILGGLAAKAGKQTTLANMQNYIKPEFLSQWYTIMKRNYNFAKHADRDAEESISFSSRQAETAIFTAVEDYMSVFGQNTQIMAIFKAWFFMAYPGWIKDTHKPLAFEKFAFLNHADARSRALSMLNYMEDNRAELKPLIPIEIRSVIEV